MTAHCDLGKQLRAYRHDDRGRMLVSAQELAEEMGWVSGSTITRREKGEISMTRAELLRLGGAIEDIMERRRQARSPAELLAGSG